GVTDSGNFEHGSNVLHLTGSPEEIANRYNLSVDDLWKRLNPLKNKLLDARKNRIHPGCDDKILTSWNALMISSFVSGWKILQEKQYLESAINATNFILKNML